MTSSPRPVVVVGAGIAGLACAADLVGAGWAPLVLERSRGVGGRCATRRIAGQAVDHGVVFLHGSASDFVRTVREALGPGGIEDWPRRIEGEGAPCQGGAFAPGERRFASRQGITAFPKALAEGLDVRRGTRVVSLRAEAGGLRVGLEDGGVLTAADVVLGLPGEAAKELLEPLAGDSRDAASACAILRDAGSLPCLTLIAGYPPEGTDPGWDVCYPESSRVIQLVAHDTAKRPPAPWRVLVYQARASWSRARLEAEPSSWAAEILAEAGSVIGRWASSAAWTDVQRWRHARAAGGEEMAGPLLLRVPGGGRIGIAGELFAPGGGVEAAWVSGRAVARRMVRED